MKALIVEDDPQLSFLWTQTLASEGFQCDCVSRSKDATGFLLRGGYDIVILDLLVKDGNTLSLSDWINVRAPDTPILMLTGSNVFQNGEHVTEAKGVSWFLRKPVRPKDLREMVLYLVDQKRQKATQNA